MQEFEINKVIKYFKDCKEDIDDEIKMLERLKLEKAGEEKIYNLGGALMEWLAPRLKRIIKIRNNQYVIEEEEKKELKELLYFVENYSDECPYGKKEYKNFMKIHNKGMKLFVKYFRDLII